MENEVFEALEDASEALKRAREIILDNRHAIAQTGQQRPWKALENLIDQSIEHTKPPRWLQEIVEKYAASDAEGEAQADAASY